jgi:hypothetical protein
MYFEVHVVATEFRRKILATAAPHFLRFFFLIAVNKKSSNGNTCLSEEKRHAIVHWVAL